VAHNFRPYNQDQLFLMPPSVKEWVAEDSLARFVSDVVDELGENGGLSAFYARYRGDGWGRAAYNPCMMVKVLLYGYALGVRSSRKLAQALVQDVAFRYLAANQQPDFRTISDFRKTHLKALEGLFVTSLDLCRKAGLLDLGCVALDGRKLRGNTTPASSRTRKQLEKLAQQILQEAEDVDAEEDRLFGDKRGDELPEGLRTEAGRRERIRAALKQVREEREALERGQAERVKAWEEKKAAGEKQLGPKPSETPHTKRMARAEGYRANVTDPDSRLLKTRRGWVQGYNGQAMVDCTSQVIVAQDLTNKADDSVHLGLLLQRCQEQAGCLPKTCLADAGYWSEANAQLGGNGMELLIAVERESRTLDQPDKRPRTRLKQLPQAVRMRARLDTEEGRETYRKRASSVEPVFGQMHERGLNHFLLRGVVKVRAEWSLICSTHNLLKLFRAARKAKLSPSPA
jgi:transposase